MKKFAIYDKNTMEVVQVSMLPESDLIHYENYIEFKIDNYNPIDFTYKVVDGLVIEESRTDEFYLNQKLKQEKIIKLNAIEVIYNDIIYQGDEVSQTRISRTINSLPNDEVTIKWKAKDNSSQDLNRQDLKKILFLASQKQTEIWFN